MSETLTSHGLAETAAGEKSHSHANTSSIPRKLLFGFISTLFAATIALWLKFGESVFTTSIMNAILACF